MVDAYVPRTAAGMIGEAEARNRDLPTADLLAGADVAPLLVSAEYPESCLRLSRPSRRSIASRTSRAPFSTIVMGTVTPTSTGRRPSAAGPSA